MSSPFVKLYENMFAALSLPSNNICGTPPDKVPEENIRPTDDPLEPVPGMSLVYSITASKRDLKSGKIEGTMQVTTGSSLSKIHAHEIMDLARFVLVPRKITGNGILVMLFSEAAQAQDAGVVVGSWRVTTAFSFKLVEGSLT